jgi:hypothetical protein
MLEKVCRERASGGKNGHKRRKRNENTGWPKRNSSDPLGEAIATSWTASSNCKAVEEFGETPLAPVLSPTKDMTVLTSARRRIQRLSPYLSLLLLSIPVILVEQLKIVSLYVAGRGHWRSGRGMIIGAYALSLFSWSDFSKQSTEAFDVGLVCEVVEAYGFPHQSNWNGRFGAISN